MIKGTPRCSDRAVLGGMVPAGAEHHEGREAVMPDSGLEFDIAECNDPCVLQFLYSVRDCYADA